MTSTVVYTPPAGTTAVTNLRIWQGSRTGTPLQTTPTMTAQPDGTFTASTELPAGTYLTSVQYVLGGVTYNDDDDSFALVTDPQPTETLLWTAPSDDPTALPVSLRIYASQGGALLRTVAWRLVGTRYAATFPSLPDGTYYQRLGYTGAYGDDSQDGPLTLPVTASVGAAPAWSPTPAQVAALITQRTVERSGQNRGRPTGAFTTTTVPSATQVQGICDVLAREVQGACGTVPASLTAQASDVAATGAAARVELTFFREDNDSTYDDLQALYTESLTRLRYAVKDLADGSADGGLGTRAFSIGGIPSTLTGFGGGSAYGRYGSAYGGW